MRTIRNYLFHYGEVISVDMATEIGLSTARTRVILSNMDDVVVTETTNKGGYRLRNKRYDATEYVELVGVK